MASRKIRWLRLRILDEMGFSELSRRYVCECSNIRDLCDQIFPPRKDGKRVGTSVLYEWLKSRGHELDWEYTKAFKKELLAEAIKEQEAKASKRDWRMFLMEVRASQVISENRASHARTIRSENLSP